MFRFRSTLVTLPVASLVLVSGCAAAPSRQIYGDAPFLDPGRPVTQLHHECESWPAPPTRPEPWVTGAVAVPPTLTVSITPPADARCTL